MGVAVKVDLPLLVQGEALAGVGEAARSAEQAGFDGVSCSELASDPLLHLTIAAGVTTRVDLMTNIVVAFARSPMTLAVQGRAIQEYSQGRLTLGLGSQIKPHIEKRFSMPWGAPANRMAEYISAMRAIWHSWSTGDRLDFRGEFYTHTLMTPMFTPISDYPPPRIYLAAVGEHMTETAGAVADGLLLHPFTTRDYFDAVTAPALERGRRNGHGDRDAQDFTVAGSTFVVTGRTEEEFAASRRFVRNQIGFYGSTPAYRPVLAQHGLQDLADELNRLSKTRDEDKWRAMGDLVDDDLLAKFAVVGEPDSIGRQFVDRWGGVVGRYQLSAVGMADPDLTMQVARNVQQAGPASA